MTDTTKKTTMNVVVHKAALALLKGETVNQFTTMITDLARGYLVRKLNLQKDDSVWSVEVMADKAVFNVYTSKSMSRSRYYAVKYTRDIKKNTFGFGEVTEVRRVTMYEPLSTDIAATGFKIAKNAPASSDTAFIRKSTNEYVEKPYPNEHAARQTNPGKYDDFRRGKLKGAPTGISVIYGITKGPPRRSEIQSVRFDRTKFTVAEAKVWLKKHDMKTTIEAATGKSAKKEFGQMAGAGAGKGMPGGGRRNVNTGACAEDGPGGGQGGGQGAGENRTKVKKEAWMEVENIVEWGGIL